MTQAIHHPYERMGHAAIDARPLFDSANRRQNIAFFNRPIGIACLSHYCDILLDR